jgi:hypothetical protein
LPASNGNSFFTTTNPAIFCPERISIVSRPEHRVSVVGYEHMRVHRRPFEEERATSSQGIGPSRYL